MNGSAPIVRYSRQLSSIRPAANSTNGTYFPTELRRHARTTWRAPECLLSDIAGLAVPAPLALDAVPLASYQGLARSHQRDGGFQSKSPTAAPTRSASF